MSRRLLVGIALAGAVVTATAACAGAHGAGLRRPRRDRAGGGGGDRRALDRDRSGRLAAAPGEPRRRPDGRPRVRQLAAAPDLGRGSAVHPGRAQLRARHRGLRAPHPRLPERPAVLGVRAVVRALHLRRLAGRLARLAALLGSARGRRVPGLPAQPAAGQPESRAVRRARLRLAARRGGDPRHHRGAPRAEGPPGDGADPPRVRPRPAGGGRGHRAVLRAARARRPRRGGDPAQRGLLARRHHVRHDPGRVPRRSAADADAPVEGRGAGGRARLRAAAGRGAGRDRARARRPLARARLLAPRHGTLRRPRRTRARPSPRSPAVR